ncbi:phage tail sheath C-terminal domain-containing protein [Streptomyces stramineus]
MPAAPYAAGVLAAAEHARGLPYGPAGTPLAGVVGVAEGPGGTTPADGGTLGTLHRAGVNVCLLDRDGVRITAARTLARDPAWRQLSVRRTVTFLERTLEQRLAWAAFEPDDDLLRARVRVAVEHLLLDLFAAGAFAGSVPAESFSVRVPPVDTAGGAGLLCEIGVAPGAPLEFLLVRVFRADGELTLRTETGT